MSTTNGHGTYASRLGTAAAGMDGQKPREPLIPAYLSIDELVAEAPHLRPPIVHGVLRRGETMNIIASPKVGKSWLVTDLALCLASGRMWLSRYELERSRVLMIDNELHKETIAWRIPTIAKSRGIMVDHYRDNLRIESLRGRNADLRDLEGYFQAVGADVFDVIIIDAWYRMIPQDMEENSNGDLKVLYNMLDGYAKMTGAAFIIIHHASKGNQSEKSVTDMGSGGGVQARAADTHLAIREHEEEGAAVVESATRSWPRPDKFVMRWKPDQHAWEVDESLDPAHLKLPNGRKRRDKESDDAAVSTPPPEPWTVERFVAQFIESRPLSKTTVLARAAIRPGLSGRASKAFYDVAIADGHAFEWADVHTPGGKLVATQSPDLMDISGINSAPKRPRGRPRKTPKIEAELAEMEVENAA